MVPLCTPEHASATRDGTGDECEKRGTVFVARASQRVALTSAALARAPAAPGAAAPLVTSIAAALLHPRNNAARCDSQNSRKKQPAPPAERGEHDTMQHAGATACGRFVQLPTAAVCLSSRCSKSASRASLCCQNKRDSGKLLRRISPVRVAAPQPRVRRRRATAPRAQSGSQPPQRGVAAPRRCSAPRASRGVCSGSRAPRDARRTRFSARRAGRGSATRLHTISSRTGCASADTP